MTRITSCAGSLRRAESWVAGGLMNFGSMSAWTRIAQKVRSAFKAREIFVHDGRAVRRIHLSTNVQAGAFAGAFFFFLIGAFGIFQAIVGVPALTGALSGVAARNAELAQMESKVEALQGEVAMIRSTAREHAARLEARQVMLAAAVKGEAAPGKLASLAASNGAVVDPQIEAVFAGLEREQQAMAGAARAATERQNRQLSALYRKLGIATPRPADSAGTGIGGPYEPVTGEAAAAAGRHDAGFKALFDSMQRRNQLQLGIVSIPSARPVEIVTVNSGFGVRSDPFRGGRAMHAGVDMPGPVGTPIYATADGRVGRAGWYGGYGNLVELEHGRGIQTRYGHLSSILVAPGTRVKRGQLIGLMGSTGRSTGSHLHYEVRIEGRAVNPIPFLQTSDYLLAMSKRPPLAVGGPVEPATSK